MKPAKKTEQQMKARQQFRTALKLQRGILSPCTWDTLFKYMTKKTREEEFLKSLHQDHKRFAKAHQQTHWTSTREVHMPSCFMLDLQTGKIVDRPHSNGPGQSGQSFVEAEWSGIRPDPFSTTTGD